MKNLLTKVLLCLSIALLLTCDNTLHDRYLISGEIEGLADTKILILMFDEGVKIDTIKSVDGKFSYSGSTNKPIRVRLLAQVDDSKQSLAEFILENSKIKVNGSMENVDRISVTGSQSDKILNAYLKEDQFLVDQWNSIKVRYDQAFRNEDTINTKKLRNQLNNILYVDRVTLLKKYVLEHYDQPVGSLIPNFCTLENILTAEDYLEMYNMLAEESKATYYGQMIKLKARNK